MLLDRKRIERWWRWTAIGLAIIFVLSFVLLGVGSSSAGNVLLGCEKQESVSSDSYFEQQENYYRGIIEDNPNDATAMVELAVLYASEGIGRYDEAVELLNRAITVDAANAPARIELARLNLTVFGDTGEALRLMEEAAAVAPNDPQVFLQLGIVAREAGQNARAIEAWTRFLELDPNNPNAETIRSEISVLQTLPPVTVTEEPAPAEGAEPGTQEPVPVTP